MDGGSDGRGGRKEEKECAAKCSKGDALLKMSNGEERRERKKEKEWFGGGEAKSSMHAGSKLLLLLRWIRLLTDG